METRYIESQSRGKAELGWLKSFHTYSFAHYFDQERMGFGALRVINDDRLSPGKGFGEHSHENMEIISIPTFGELAHKDSMGNQTIIKSGEVQAMSAGSGISHSEINPSKDKEVRFFQIWIQTRKENIEPSYSQKEFPESERKNKLQLIVAPDTSNKDVVKIHQDAYFTIGEFEAGQSCSYELYSHKNGVFALLIEGSLKLAGQELKKRDGLEIKNTEKISFVALEKATVLLIEVPLENYSFSSR